MKDGGLGGGLVVVGGGAWWVLRWLVLGLRFTSGSAARSVDDQVLKFEPMQFQHSTADPELSRVG